MSRVTKFLLLIPAAIIMLDVLLMIINGTLLMVLLTFFGFYLIASLAFKESAFESLKRWINTGHLSNNHQEVNYGQPTRKS
ncbi:hypothetical protein PB1A_0774 [Leuconostoc inhae]|uniref:Uncharacterized protein n=2 Tax=Leuconostoc TaxID=1243 RepID=A0ABM9V3S4_9LACO|nr:MULTISPECIES: hypothetical protein [Leuconostoc]MBM7435717.1 hypothetical protein [Leuconostoc rapi]MBZ5959108.1 hypothetical protein [Leuconostoc gasicomitatum]MBZ5981480.1 hypothetical protein [Leuconostoc gasicomitatum]MBZ5982021.1 hypothetical protein [Leuconostoc gasicomitatum]MBZ5987668.1 hypothetical protein [Leuconostoc gasicomitatum]